MTLEVGDTAKFLCTVDMTCMVSYVEWYKHDSNGAEELGRVSHLQRHVPLHRGYDLHGLLCGVVQT